MSTIAVDWVDIIEDSPGVMTRRCSGPTAEGRCPAAAHYGVVACAGCYVACGSAPPEYWMVWVPPGSQHCPFTWSLEASY